jgi:hypothetical protein
MALTEETVIDQVSIDENGTIFVRRRLRVLRDGEAIAQSYHRTSHEPGSDLSNADAKVQAISGAVWTQGVVETWKQKVAAKEAEMVAVMARNVAARL